MRDDEVDLKGEVILGPQRMKIKKTGAGVKGITIPARMLDALRVRVKRHHFLELKIVREDLGGGHSRVCLVATTCAKQDIEGVKE